MDKLKGVHLPHAHLQQPTQNLTHITPTNIFFYTFSKDQEPLDLHKKLYVRLFKRSEKRREQQQRTSELASTVTTPTKQYRMNPKDNLIRELVIMEENGQTTFKPKNVNNSLRYMQQAQFEIKTIEKEYKKLSQLEKNRIFLKFVEMNESPHKYSHYEHYKEGKQRKVQLKLNQRDLMNIYKGKERDGSIGRHSQTASIGAMETSKLQQMVNQSSSNILMSGEFNQDVPFLKQAQYCIQSPILYQGELSYKHGSLCPGILIKDLKARSFTNIFLLLYLRVSSQLYEINMDSCQERILRIARSDQTSFGPKSVPSQYKKFRLPYKIQASKRTRQRLRTIRLEFLRQREKWQGFNKNKSPSKRNSWMPLSQIRCQGIS